MCVTMATCVFKYFEGFPRLTFCVVCNFIPAVVDWYMYYILCQQ